MQGRPSHATRSHAARLTRPCWSTQALRHTVSTSATCCPGVGASHKPSVRHNHHQQWPPSRTARRVGWQAHVAADTPSVSLWQNKVCLSSSGGRAAEGKRTKEVAAPASHFLVPMLAYMARASLHQAQYAAAPAAAGSIFTPARMCGVAAANCSEPARTAGGERLGSRKTPHTGRPSGSGASP